jgi:hypothetical protein
MQRIADRRLDHVRSRRVGNNVAGIVDDVDVIARAAIQMIGAGFAIERVVATVAGDRIGKRIARAADAGRALEQKVFDVAFERMRDRRLDEIEALVGAFDDLIPGIVDDIDVVARAAGHHILAGAAVELVDAGEAIERVIAAKPEQAVGQSSA